MQEHFYTTLGVQLIFQSALQNNNNTKASGALTNVRYHVEYLFVMPLRAAVVLSGRMAEWSKATDCKSVGESLRWFKSNSYHHFYVRMPLPHLSLTDADLAQ